jgi:FKBP-type peptidyl-prolyl cis-trans isomerase FkpA
MKKAIMTTSLVLACATTLALAEDKPAAAAPAAPAAAPAAEAAPNPAFPDEKSRLSYALGNIFSQRYKQMQTNGEKMNFDAVKQGMADIIKKKDLDYAIGAGIASQLLRDEVEYDPEIVVQAFRDIISGSGSKMNQQESQAEITKLQQKLQERQQAAQKKEAEGNEKAAAEFFEKNKIADGVKTTESGIQYKVLTPAKDDKAPKPKASDSVTCNYRGTLLDGTEFDKSPDGAPRTFSLQNVIKGWTEGIQLMSEGSKYRFWIPAALAYGATPRPGGVIKPGHALIFDVELTKIEPAAAPPTLPPNPLPGDKAVATTQPISVEMKDGKPVIKTVDEKDIPKTKTEEKPAEKK